MDKSQIRWLCISLGISFTVLFVFLLLTFDTNTLDELQNCNIWLILLALIMHIVSIGFWALRIKYMCWSLGYKVPFLHSFNLVCSNQFIASVTPSQIGGEPVRIYELTKARVPAGEATAVVIMERVFDAVVLAVGTVVRVLLLSVFITTLDLPEDYVLLSYFAAGVFTALLILFFIVAKNPRIGTFLITKVMKFITQKWPNKKIISMQTK